MIKFNDIKNFITPYCINLDRTDEKGDISRQQLIIRIHTRRKYQTLTESDTVLLSDFISEYLSDKNSRVDKLAYITEITFIQNVGPDSGKIFPVEIRPNSKLHTVDDLITELAQYVEILRQYQVSANK